MCTLAAKKINNSFFIFKNRDLTFPRKTRVIREVGKTKKLIITDEKGHYEGLNEHGIGCIFATLIPYPFKKYPDSSTIAKKILNQTDIKDVFNIIKNSKISVNIIVSDKDNAFIVEKTPYDFSSTKIRDNGVITNTSIKLNKKNGSQNPESHLSSRLRYLRAKKVVKNIKNFPDIIEFLGDKVGYPCNSICRGNKSVAPTYSSFIFDLKNKKLYFSKDSPDNKKFKEYGF